MSRHTPFDGTPPTGHFRKVLVANRGEIARRIFRTLRNMGLGTVAVFSDADRDAPHVAEADEAVHLGPAPSTESYLDQEAVIAAAEAIGADAIHPGYGFLAENPEFAQRCGEAGVVFVGPSPETIRRMGDKAEAKALAARLGVPVLEGFALDGLDSTARQQKADALGFPLLIKAVAGGGGKGMRVVSQPCDMDAALEAACREAEGAFGDGSLIAERYIDSARHVEVQILGDVHGRVMHCFERDCSLQRRHQKVFEESPAPGLSQELRQRMGEAAVAVARAVDYRGAGTVEFLLAPDDGFFFLEMNTRLQVEHPVTEAVTGLDLVRLQIEIAQGLPIGFDQADLQLSGHAIEARLYAEDPANEFLPATGTVTLWTPPRLPGLRIDSGVETSSEIGIHYDPMLAKVIAHGRDRDEALRRLHRGLSELAVGGLVTNRDFLLAVLEHDGFRLGEVHTNFLEQLPDSSRAQQVDRATVGLHAIAATLHLIHERRQAPNPVPAGILCGWRNNRLRPQEQAFEHAGERLTVHYVARRSNEFELDVDLGDDSSGDTARESRSLIARIVSFQDDRLVAEVDGVQRRFRIGRHSSDRGLSVHGLGRVCELTLVPRFPERQASAVAGGCAAPMTGKIIEVLVAEGDRVSAGTPLVILEAMKMEHRLEAHGEGVVESVHAHAGQMVDPDEVLVVVTPLVGDQESGA